MCPNPASIYPFLEFTNDISVSTPTQVSPNGGADIAADKSYCSVAEKDLTSTRVPGAKSPGIGPVILRGAVGFVTAAWDIGARREIIGCHQSRRMRVAHRIVVWPATTLVIIAFWQNLAHQNGITETIGNIRDLGSETGAREDPIRVFDTQTATMGLRRSHIVSVAQRIARTVGRGHARIPQAASIAWLNGPSQQ